MGRLIGYGAGEIMDRLSILALKIQHTSTGTAAHFLEEERALIRVALHTEQVPLDTLLRLTVVNAEIWHAEDVLRAHRARRVDATAAVEPEQAEHASGDLRSTALQIQALNDQRAALIHAINRATGHDGGAEKS